MKAFPKYEIRRYSGRDIVTRWVYDGNGYLDAVTLFDRLKDEHPDWKLQLIIR